MLMLYELPLLVITNVVAIVMALIIIFARSVQRSQRASLVVTIISLLIWQDIIFIADHATRQLLLLNTLLFIWPTVAIISFYIFLRVFNSKQELKNEHRKARQYLIATFVGGVALQLGAVASSKIFNAVTLNMNGVYDFERGYAYSIYIVGLSITLIGVAVRLIMTIATTRKNTKERQALKGVLYTVCLASVCGLWFNAFIPAVTGSQYFIGLGVATVDIFAIGFTLSVVSGRLLDIKLYAIRSVAYVLALATLAALYITLAYVVSRWLEGSAVTFADQSTLNMILALLLALAFQPAKHFFDKLTGRVFYRDNYNTDDFFARINRELNTTTDLRSLLQRAATEIGETVKAEQSFFFVRYGEGRFMMAGTKQHHRLPLSEMARLDGYVSESKHQVIVADMLSEADPLAQILSKHNLGVTLPLKMSDGSVGYLFLGTPLSRGYTRRDIRLLETIADELVIAIQNALSIQDVEEINLTLQQRIEDATKELRRSNAQLQRLDTAKDEFISMASHQLRTPLTSVKGYISMVLEGDAGKITDMQHKLLSEAFVSSERMVHLISDFLNVSRLQTGKFMLEQHEVDLAKVTAQEVDGLQTIAKSHDLKLKFRAGARLPILYIDESKIRQVIMNFVDNAIYYSREFTTITISLNVDAGDILLQVHDTGIGVPAAEQLHLFTKFFRATNARKQRPDGTGVGLFLAKKVIVAHGGSMVFHSVEGEGSTFGFRLPIKKLQSAPAHQADDL